MNVYALAASAAEGRDAERRLAADGWVINEGFELPDEPWDLSAERMVCTGAPDPSNPSAVLLAAARGCSLILVAVDREAYDTLLLVDQLARLGCSEQLPDGPANALGVEEAALLDRLADGHAVAAAARALNMSIRTANRRLAAARAALGVESNRQAVVTYRRMGTQ
ncbi:hypothetical protein BH20ACT4_BH20ACT4_04050 [soil metagenome]